MEKKNDLITFICALIPGVGYMYLGLMERGIEALAIFLLIEPVFRFVGIGFFADIVKILFWIYTFSDTYKIAHKINRGEYVEDGFVFGKGFKNGSFNMNKGDYNTESTAAVRKNKFNILGWVLIAVGIIAILNKAFEGTDIYYLIKSYISAYFLPVALIVVGLYVLIKKN
ncbi:hypothetical protein [Haloimpatiens lingqiaonensis]|uniref:hypothetical protein n=1 Tax=Haloimpatiens lingqiaonensis TaxID=1380675 RepID=UPI001FAB0590|nr:hypothetical protein [Haloimpatiens lingqiaonensis]